MGCGKILLSTNAMQSVNEEELHSQLLMVHFLHTEEPLKECLLSC